MTTLRRITLVSAMALVVLPAAANAQFFWDNDDGFDSDRVVPAPPPPAQPRVKHVRKAQKPAIAKESTKPKGPLLISISIEEQQLKVYDSNGLYAETPISTGMRGHATPMGVFSVIGKEKFHRSNIYSNAPMPYMQRITWSGVAMHAGVLPGYPASHGCIRMPMNFAVRMYGWTRLGARVVIAPGELSPVDFSHPLLFTHRPEPEPQVTTAADKSGATAALPELKPVLDLESGLQATNGIAAPVRMADASGATPVTTGIAPEPDKAQEQLKEQAKPVKRKGHIAAFISRKEGKIFVRQNFAPLFEAPVTIADGGPLGTHIFTLHTAHDDPHAFQWSVVSLPPRQPSAPPQARKHQRGEHERPTVEVALPSPSEALDRITIPGDAMQKIAEAAMPGDSLTVSDLGLGNETGLGTDFIVPLR